MWVVDHHHMSSTGYRPQYMKHIQPSEPSAEFDDRLKLYSAKAYLMYSAHCRGQYTRQREMSSPLLSRQPNRLVRAFAVLSYLVEKYVPLGVYAKDEVMPASRTTNLTADNQRRKEISIIVEALTREGQTQSDRPP